MGAMKQVNENARTYGYFRWLSEMVHADELASSYYLLLKELHSIPFTYIIDRDVNRSADAKMLRREYFGNAPDIEGGLTSVLEVLIGIAQRCNDNDMEEQDDDRTADWFWEFIRNLNLDIFTDEMFYDWHGNYKVDKVVTLFLERKYDKHGKGGIFPLHHSRKNQRRVEIWYQMSSYLQEKYSY